jgi:hypothetical protein
MYLADMEESKAIPSASSIGELVEPVRSKLKHFAPDMSYEPDNIKRVLQMIAMRRRVKGAELMPDGEHFAAKAQGDALVLLIDHTCKAFVDPAVAGKKRRKKRIPRSQEAFVFDLNNEIYRLENGDALFSVCS